SIQAERLAPAEGLRLAVPNGEADALVTTAPCPRGGASQLARIRLARIIPKAGEIGNLTPPVSLVICSPNGRLGRNVTSPSVRQGERASRSKLTEHLTNHIVR